MVDHWLDAIGDRNPIYSDEAAAKAAGHPGVVAPPAMIQVWTMMGLGGVRPDDDPLGKIITMFDDAGYIGVVATNCEQTYHRPAASGEEVSVTMELTDVIGPKNTALGEDFFITQKITWSVGDDGEEEPVADMIWRIPQIPSRRRRALGNSHRHRSTRPGADDDPAGRLPGRSSSGTASMRTNCASSAPDGSCNTPGSRRVAGQGTPRRLRGRQRRWNRLQLRGPPRTAGPGRTLPFVIALVELEECGCRRTSQRRSVGGGDRNAGPRNVHRLPRRREAGRPGRCTRGARLVTATTVNHAARAVALETRHSSCRRPSPPGTTRTFTTTGIRRRQKVPGHLRQHPHRHRPRPALHHRLAGPNAVIKSIACVSASRGTPRHRHVQGRGHRRRRRTDHRESRWQQQPGDHVGHRHPDDRRCLMPGELSGKAAIAGIGATDFSGTPVAASCAWPPRRSSMHSTTPGLTPVTSTAW